MTHETMRQPHQPPVTTIQIMIIAAAMEMAPQTETMKEENLKLDVDAMPEDSE
jgi:hypothetical protein